MRFSTRTTYGLKAMVDLALHEGQGPIPVAAIAKRQGIPMRYLEQLLHRLRRANLVVAERGARGGYHLHRSPSQISVADIVQVFEAKPVRRPRAAGRDPSTGRGPQESRIAVDHATSLVWTRIEVAITTALATTTLAELATEARRRHTNHTFTFHI